MLFRKPKNYARVYKCTETGEQFALFAVNGPMKDAILDRFRMTYQVKGTCINSGGVADEKTMLGVVAGGLAALKASAAASGTLFIATADPASLMVIGNGVGSAVMAGGHIVAQAPFISIAGALMPVAAPLLAFQALSTILILDQFKTINRRLIAIERVINRVLQRQEATFFGQANSACLRLESLEKEFLATKRFTLDMITRLALVEDTINENVERYKFLYEAESIDEELTGDDLIVKQNDAYMAIELSALDIRVGVLRVRLTIQENPGYVRQSVTALISKVERYEKLWRDIETSPKRVQEVSEKIRKTVEEMGWWKRTMPGWLLGNPNARSERVKANLLDKIIQSEDTTEIRNTATTTAGMGSSLKKALRPVALLYWEDELGRHAYYTNDLQLQ